MKPLSLSSRLNLLLFAAVFRPLAAVRRPCWKPPFLASGSKVLIFSTAGLGDMLLDSPVTRAFAETFPGIRLHWVAHRRRLDIPLHNPLLEHVHAYSKGPLAFVRLYWRLREHGPFDAVLYLSCLDPEARCLGFLLNRTANAGLAYRSRWNWITALPIDFEGIRSVHLSRQALLVGQAFGAHTKCPRMVYTVKTGEQQALSEQLQRERLPLRPLLTLQLGGGGFKHRDWPAGHYVELLKILVRMGFQGPFFLLGGPDHQAKAEAVMEGLKAARSTATVYNLAGRISLPLAAALLERSHCVLSTDTGIMHLAFALQTPTVALIHWSPGAEKVGPLADGHLHRVVALPRPAPPLPAPSASSMTEITPETVAESVLSLLKAPMRELPAGA